MTLNPYLKLCAQVFDRCSEMANLRTKASHLGLSLLQCCSQRRVFGRIETGHLLHTLDPHANLLHLLADAHTLVACIAPSILELLDDGIPRSKRAFVAALAERHAKDEVVRTLMRLAVIGQLMDG